LSLLWWNVAISQAWLNRIATTDEIQWSLKNNDGNVNAKNASGWTGLMLAADIGDLERTQLLIQHKADPNIVSNDQNRCTALHMLCRKSLMTDRNMAIMKLLLDNGANANVRDAYGRIPLHWIGGIGDANYRTKVLDLLMKHGANLNAVDNDGNPPLNFMIDILWSRDSSWFETALLIPYGSKIDPNIRNKRGETSVDFAQNRKCLPIVKALCKTNKWKCTDSQRAGSI
jgi:FOG: Ankyrin repeat